MTGEEKIRLCEGIAAALLTHLEAFGGTAADPLMLTHAVRDLASLCADQQRQLNFLLEAQL